jgi:hypothetical protein
MSKPPKTAWIGSLIHSIILIPFLIYLHPEYNINCFVEPCINWLPNFFLYPILFLLFYFLVCVIPINYLLVWLDKKINSK